MPDEYFQIRQLADELPPPESGKQSIVLTDDNNEKVVLFAFAARGFPVPRSQNWHHRNRWLRPRQPVVET
jgi:hypothetical protein